MGYLLSLRGPSAQPRQPAALPQVRDGARPAVSVEDGLRAVALGAARGVLRRLESPAESSQMELQAV